MKRILIILIIIHAGGNLLAQDDWIVPDSMSGEISPFVFEEEMILNGEHIYSNSCISCHGTPTENNPMLFIPSPGDPASEKFQAQTDGSMFFKIHFGRGGMPSFGNTLAIEDIWSLVAFIRSFNSDYSQPEFDYGDEVLADLELFLSHDENVDKLVVKVKSNGEFGEGIEVSSFIVGLFGKFPLGSSLTNEKGIAYFDVDPTLPGDEEGNVLIQVRAQQGYSIKKQSQEMSIVQPVVKTSLIDGRHLWSTALKAPIWLIVIFNLIIIGIWGLIIYILIGLSRLKKVA